MQAEAALAVGGGRIGFGRNASPRAPSPPWVRRQWGPRELRPLLGCGGNGVPESSDPSLGAKAMASRELRPLLGCGGNGVPGAPSPPWVRRQRRPERSGEVSLSPPHAQAIRYSTRCGRDSPAQGLKRRASRTRSRCCNEFVPTPAPCRPAALRVNVRVPRGVKHLPQARSRGGSLRRTLHRWAASRYARPKQRLGSPSRRCHHTRRPAFCRHPVA